MEYLWHSQAKVGAIMSLFFLIWGAPPNHPSPSPQRFYFHTLSRIASVVAEGLISVPTTSRAFIGWAIFLSTVFECLDLKMLPGVVQAYLPQEFYDAGYGETEALGDATETQFENYEINHINFSSYKNHTIWKTSVWIYPHGGLLHYTDAYPGTITDKDTAEQCKVLDKVNKRKFSEYEYSRTSDLLPLPN